MSQSESSASEHIADGELQIPERKICMCNICKKEFKKNGSLYKHMREIHNEDPPLTRKPQLRCPEPTCALAFLNRPTLRDHIQACHGVNIEFCVKKFQTFKDFEIWKENVEKETNSKYSATNSCMKGRKFSYYGCHRSGIFISKSTGKRKLKHMDSNKINGCCPAAMDVARTEKGVEVKFWKTHFGHTCDVGALILTRQEKTEIANKLKGGTTFQEILDEVHDSVLETGVVRRIHLLKKKDLYNICRSFKISNKEDLQQKEQSNINAWLANMRALGDDCPIIFYKEKGVEELTLKSPEFFLVIMTKLQQKMLIACENSIVCIDCIYHIHTFSYYLITLMTVDAYDSCCPLAFCVTNRLNARTISLFYNSIKLRVGTISADLFMSVDKPLFYIEWQNIMGTAKNQLLCNWDIEKIWKQKLEKLSISPETRVRVHANMRLIMLQGQYGEFQSMLEDTLCQLEENNNLKEFVTFFKSKYLDKVQLWANCYRSDSVLHSTLILEQIHRDLHHCYMEGQSMSSIVRVLNLVMEISREKISEKLEKLPKQLTLELIGNSALIPGTQRIERKKKLQKLVKTVTSPVSTEEPTLIENEEVAEKQLEVPTVEVNCSYVTPSVNTKETTLIQTKDIGEKQLKVPTVEENCSYVNHIVEKVCPPNCKPICSVCCICFHKFTCSCIDFQNLNTCRHIHASVNVLKGRCIHSKEECETTLNEETAMSQNVAQEIVIEMTEEMDTRDDNSRTVDQIIETEEKTEQPTNMEEVDIENFRSLLLQKVECFHHILENNTFEPEKYAMINEYFDKIIELF